jgi:hypothetical protein
MTLKTILPNLFPQPKYPTKGVGCFGIREWDGQRVVDPVIQRTVVSARRWCARKVLWGALTVRPLLYYTTSSVLFHPEFSLETLHRGQVTRWSFTIPAACMKA